MDDFPLPRWLCTALSYLSAFTLGLYAMSQKGGHSVEAHRWVLTSLFGLMFFFASRRK
jgi:hypothetical protein